MESKMAYIQNARFWHENRSWDGSKTLQDVPKTRPGFSGLSGLSGFRTPESPESPENLAWPRTLPKTPPRRPQDAPRRLQDTSKTPQDASKIPPHASKMPARCPKMPAVTCKTPQDASSHLYISYCTHVQGTVAVWPQALRHVAAAPKL